ncbi:MAG: HAD-IA family hydrolase [Candidatus Diapherotrites archaeon]
MIKTIIFDFNGVFVEEPPENAIHEKLGSSKKNFKLLQLFFPLELTLVQEGKKPAIWLWQKLYPGIEKKVLLDIIIREYSKAKKVKKMFELCKKLKKNYDIYCLSNSNDLQAKAYKKIGFYKIFKKTFLSNEIGKVKPKPTAFKIVLEKTNNKAKDCLFVDDSLKNILTAKLLGFKTIKFKNFETFVAELSKEGIKV